MITVYLFRRYRVFHVRHLCNDNFWGMLLISLNFLHSPSTFSVCSIVPNNVQQCTMCGVQLLLSLLLCTLNVYYTMLIVLHKFNSIKFNSIPFRKMLEET